jgi:hypothetical protein
MNLPIAGLLALLVATGCAPLEQAPAPDVRAGAPQEKAAAVKPPETPPVEAKVATAEAAAPRTAAADSAPPSPEKTATPDAKVDAPEVKAPATAPAEPVPKKETAAPAPPKPSAAPPLDLNALEKRLKDTDAIGVFTKLTLKNQVDDLLAQFEAHHEGAGRTSLAELRQPYDLLIIKVLSLLQDRDARLANDLIQSREAIWNILSDPVRFQRLVNENRS